jgi:hypothetical protein
MVWIPRYFLHRAEAWVERVPLLDSTTSPGAVAYAKRQAAGWAKMASSSIRIFKVVNPRVADVWGVESGK